MPKTYVVTADRDGRVLALFDDATIDGYSFRLNEPGTCTFSIPNVGRPSVTVTSTSSWPESWPASWGTAVTVTSRRDRPVWEVADPEQGHEVWVVRAGQVVWAGPLWTVDEDEDRITFGALSLEVYLSDWVLYQTLETSGYPSEDASGPVPGATVVSRDQHLLVKALVDHGQALAGGDRRIDTSTVSASGVLRDRQYAVWEGYDVLTLVRNLSEVDNGPDWWIDPASRQLQLASRRGMRRPATVFNDRNVRRFARRRDRGELATEIVGIGVGYDQSTLRENRADTAAMARSGRIRKTYVNKQIGRRETLRAVAARQLRVRSTVPDLLAVTVATDEPPLFSYELGDEVRIHYRSDYRPVDVFRRVVGVDVVPHGGEEQAVLYLERLGVGT